jgi:hypothetical protein
VPPSGGSSVKDQLDVELKLEEEEEQEQTDSDDLEDKHSEE